LFDIEFSILRANLCRPTYFDFVKENKVIEVEKKEHSLQQPDPRVMFAINCVCSTGPSIRIFRTKNLYDDLEKSTHQFLEETVSIQNSKIKLPKFFEWFANDFGKTKEKMLKTISIYLNQNLQKEIINTNNNELVFSEFDWHNAESSSLISHCLSLFQLK